MSEGTRYGMEHVVCSKSETGLLETFPELKQQLVYLSPDANEDLEGFEEDKIYVIGGIVDKAVKTGLSKNKAGRLGIESRKLPLGRLPIEHLNRLCLNINSIFQIIDNFRAGDEIVDAIMKEIPKRIIMDKESGLEKGK